MLKKERKPHAKRREVNYFRHDCEIAVDLARKKMAINSRQRLTTVGTPTTSTAEYLESALERGRAIDAVLEWV